jgi:hypothetical protein
MPTWTDKRVVTFDFDDTLLVTAFDEDWGSRPIGPNEPVIAQMREHAAAGDLIIIVTSRHEQVENRADPKGWPAMIRVGNFVLEHDLPVRFILFTNGEPKAPLLETLGAFKHFDDDPEELALLPESIEGVLISTHPSWGSDTDTEA